MRRTHRTIAPLLGLLALSGVAWLAACAGEPRGGSGDGARASARPPAPPPGAARLVADGVQAFDGTSRAICSPHAREGLQVALRTAEPGLPAVALRIDQYQGDGTYQGRLFLTARAPTGALVRSSGAVRLRLAERSLPAGPAPAASGLPAAPARSLVTGTFEGTYEGEAGRGAVRGRLGPCLFTPPDPTAP